MNSILESSGIRVGAGNLILNPEQTAILMGQRGKRDVAYMKWVFPTGRVEKFDTINQTLIKEAKQETGLIVEPGEWAMNAELINPENEEHRLIIYHWSHVIGGKLQAGDDLLSVRYQTREDLKHCLRNDELSPFIQGVLRHIGWL